MGRKSGVEPALTNPALTLSDHPLLLLAPSANAVGISPTDTNWSCSIRTSRLPLRIVSSRKLIIANIVVQQHRRDGASLLQELPGLHLDLSGLSGLTVVRYVLYDAEEYSDC